MIGALPLGLVAGAAAVGVASGAYGIFVPRSTLWGPLIWHGQTSAPPRVALTFDDGPTAGATDRVLDLLGELDVKSAFFVIGRNVEREPRLLQRIVDEGHIVGNHTYDHWKWCGTGHRRYWLDQIGRADDAIAQVLGQRPSLFRPPIGHKTPYTLAAARELGHRVVTWGVRAWDGLPTTASRIVRHVVPRCRAGTIVVLHDGVEPSRPRDPSATIGAIRPLIEGLRDRGLLLVRLDELIGVASGTAMELTPLKDTR